MKINWKEEFDELAKYSTISSDPAIAFRLEPIKKFVETEIIEKLIEEIPDNMETKLGNEWGTYLYGHQLKQQLRAKWLA